MKHSQLLITSILLLILLNSACGKVPATSPAADPTASPPAPVPTQPTIAPSASPTAQALTERFGHVWVTASNELAGYVMRSFLQIPVGMAWGPDGQLYVADWAGRHIVRVGKDGSMDDLPFWKTTLLLQYDGPRSVAFDSGGNLYTNNHGHILRVDTGGNVTELDGIQGSPIGSIAISAADELYYTDRAEQGALRKWDPAGRSETIVDNLPFAENMAFGHDGTLYLTQMAQPQILKVDVSSGTVTTFQEQACENDPCFLAVDPEGDIWARGINRLTQFTPDGVEKPFIVDGAEYPGGPFYWHTAAGIAFDDEGGLWIASYNSWLRRLVPLTSASADPEFSMQTISPGMEVTDLDVDGNGDIFAPDMNTKQVFRFTVDGKIETLLEYDSAGRVAVARDDAGSLFLGMPNGKIVRLAADGTTSDYASLLTRRMVFGFDAALYAIVGDFNHPKSIVRITDVDTYTTLAIEIDGIALGNGEAHISPALDTGFYVFTEQERNLFFVDYSGQGHLIANLRPLGGGGPAVLAASPVTGDIYFIPHGPYTVFRIDAEGNSSEVASGVFGDPWGMVVSKDGNWLYVAESGAIDKIPISK